MPKPTWGHDPEATMEDLEFLSQDPRVGLTEAAKRTGFTGALVLERWLRRRERVDLYAIFADHEPLGMYEEHRRRGAVA